MFENLNYFIKKPAELIINIWTLVFILNSAQWWVISFIDFVLLTTRTPPVQRSPQVNVQICRHAHVSHTFCKCPVSLTSVILDLFLKFIFILFHMNSESRLTEPVLMFWSDPAAAASTCGPDQLVPHRPGPIRIWILNWWMIPSLVGVNEELSAEIFSIRPN